MLLGHNALMQVDNFLIFHTSVRTLKAPTYIPHYVTVNKALVNGHSKVNVLYAISSAFRTHKLVLESVKF